MDDGDAGVIVPGLVRTGLPGGLEAFSSQVTLSLRQIGDGEHPRLLGASREADDPEWALLALDVALTPGLQVRIRLMEAEEAGADPVAVCRIAARLLGRSEELEAGIQAVRDGVEAWAEARSAAGADIRLDGVGLNPSDIWDAARGPRFYVSVGLLGHDLRRVAHEIEADEAEEAIVRLEAALAIERERVAAKVWLAGRGASGWIDQLTLAMLHHDLDTARELEELGRHARTWPAEGLQLHWSEGRVRSTGDRFHGLSWHDLTLRVEGASLPDAALAAAIGRPVTTILDHPALGPEMIVEEARVEAAFDDEPVTLLVRVAARDRPFSAARGAVVDGLVPAEATSAPPTRSDL